MNITPISTAKTYAQHLCDGLTLAMHTDGWHQNYWAKESLKKIADLRDALTAAETELKEHLRLAEAANQQAMREMAEDDKAHAAMDRAAGL